MNQAPTIKEILSDYTLVEWEGEQFIVYFPIGTEDLKLKLVRRLSVPEVLGKLRGNS